MSNILETTRALVPIIPIRKEPSHTAEMVDQLLFGDPYRVIESKANWLYIETLLYSYFGYIDVAQTKAPQTLEPNSLVCEQPCTILSQNQCFNLPIGAFVHQSMVNGASFLPINATLGLKELNSLLHCFMGAPYLWGGKTVFGIDCSGLVQIIFRFAGIFLPRDAYQQAELGENVHFIEETKPFDLVFFKNEAQKIIHVGIIVGKNQVMHASAWVRIDEIDNTGIYNAFQQKYTHHLACIKRLL